MRMLLVFVVLFAVTGVAYAETKTRCSDKAYSTFTYCLTFFEEVKGIGDDLDLYSSWELRDIRRQIDTCVSFNRNESRSEACATRLLIETLGTEKIDEVWKSLSNENREALEKAGFTKEKLKEAANEYRKR